jgi:hypothetical protein
MYLLLIVGAVFAFFVWLGRRGGKPLLPDRGWRTAAGGFAALGLAGGGFLAVTGRVLPGAIVAAAAALVAFSARRNPVRKPVPEPSSIIEARAILGVGPGATREEIQAAYSRLIRMAHPDVGGTSGLAAQLNAARDALLG